MEMHTARPTNRIPEPVRRKLKEDVADFNRLTATPGFYKSMESKEQREFLTLAHGMIGTIEGMLMYDSDPVTVTVTVTE